MNDSCNHAKSYLALVELYFPLDLKNMLNDMCEERDSKVYVIPREYSGDCGAQIAWTGALTHKKNADVDVKDSWIKQSWRLDSVDVLWRK